MKCCIVITGNYNSARTDLKTRYDFLHFVPIQVEITLNKIAVDEASHWFCLLICVKRSPAEFVVKQKLHVFFCSFRISEILNN